MTSGAWSCRSCGNPTEIRRSPMSGPGGHRGHQAHARNRARELPYDRCVLIGREAECSAIRALVDAAREGCGGALVMRGEPGVGKSALLRDAESHASDLRVARAVGVEAESEIAFAAVDQAL